MGKCVVGGITVQYPVCLYSVAMVPVMNCDTATGHVTGSYVYSSFVSVTNAL